LTTKRVLNCVLFLAEQKKKKSEMMSGRKIMKVEYESDL